MMKHLHPAWPALACLLASLPSLLSAGPWDNRSRPAGFQRTLSYLAPELHSYPNPDLQKTRNSMLSDDLTMTLIQPLRQQGIPPDRWEAEGQKAFDAYGVQYEAMKNIIRQTMNNAEGIIQTVESGQRVPDNLASHPNVMGLIALRWQRLNIAEQTYQALLFAGQNPGSGSGGTHNSVPDVTPRQPAKSQNRIDWERMRETRRKAIERRRALEARWAEEARRRWEEINAIIRYLQGLGAESTSKFRATGPTAGGYVSGSAMPELTPLPGGPISPPAPAIDEIEQIEEQIEEVAEKIEAEESTPVEKSKVTVYRGTLVLRRPSQISDSGWELIKKAFIDLYARDPEVTDMEDKGDEVTWRYKALVKRESNPYITVIPESETTEEEADDKPAPKDKEPEPWRGNGDADPAEEKIVPGTEQKPVKPAPKPKPAPQPEPVAESKAVPGYWYDPTDVSRSSKDKYIYVRIDGEAVRVPLDEAENYGVPAGATLDTMTWYSDRTGKVVPGKDRGTHGGPDQPKSSNKFAKPKG
jgi:hypothetical protein